VITLCHDRAGGQATPRAEDPRPDGTTRKRGWTIRISSLELLAKLKATHYVMLVALESHCRDRSYCWCSNATLAREVGLRPSQARQVLREMEDDGLISRVHVSDRRGSPRVGIVLHDRIDRDRPVEDGPPPPPEALGRLRRALARESSGPPDGVPENRQGGAGKPAGDVPENRQVDLPENRHQNKDRSRKKDALKDDAWNRPAESEILPRSRQASPPAETVPSPPARPALRGIIPLADAPADDPIIAAELAARARAREAGARPDPPESPPAETGELIRRLARHGAPQAWVQVAAEDLARRFGTPMDRGLWGQYHAIMRLVWADDPRADAEAIAIAYEHACRPECRNRGAVFWTEVKRRTGLEASDLKAP
jgi:hypothetical protein